MTTQSEQKSLKNYIPLLSGILIVCLLLSNIFLLRFYLENSQKSIVVTSENNKLEFTKLQLETEFQKNLNALNSMRGTNSELNKIIDLKQAELLAMKAKLDGELAQNGNVADALSAMQTIKQQNLNNLRLLDSLRTDNIALKSQVKQNEQQIALLEQKKGELNANLERLKSVQEQQNVVIALVTEESKKKDEKLNALNATMEKAKFIAVGNLSVTPKGTSWWGKEKSTDKAKNVDSYHICFTPVANALAPKGKQTFHLQLLNALGESVQIGDKEIKTEHGLVRSTLPIDIVYEGEAKSHCFDWKPAKKLNSGSYDLIIYHDGLAAGSNKFSIK